MREKGVDLIEVHVAGICFSKDKVFIAKRSKERSIYPNVWECGGGQVKKGETFEVAVKRQLSEEFGIVVKPLQTLGTYKIENSNIDQKVIPGIKFICEFEEFVNGESIVITDEHTEGKLVTIKDLDDYDFIPGLKEDILEAYGIYKGTKIPEWDLYEISTVSTIIKGVKFRGRIRKLCLENSFNVLVENNQDKENSVRFAVLSKQDPSFIVDYISEIIPDSSVGLIKKSIKNPVLSKLVVNDKERYDLY